MTEHKKREIVDDILRKRSEIEGYLKRLEKSIYDTETNYLKNSENSGNIIRGWEQTFIAKSRIAPQPIHLTKKHKFSDKERMFSISSSTNNFVSEDVIQSINKNSNIININMEEVNNNAKKKSSSKKKKILVLKKKK